MNGYSITINTVKHDEAMKIINDLSHYDCKINLLKNAKSKNYVFNYEEASYHKLGEKTGRTVEEFKLDQDFYNYISGILKAYGLKEKHKGFTYAIECVRLMHLFNNEAFTMNGDIYPVVSNWYNKSPNAIEHDIRNCIIEAWDNYQDAISSKCNAKELKKYRISSFKKRPTNISFLKHIAKITINEIY